MINEVQPDTRLPKTPAVAEYTALVTQTSTNIPTSTILKNTTGLTWVWTRTATGVYHLTPSEETNGLKTTITMPNNLPGVLDTIQAFGVYVSSPPMLSKVTVYTTHNAGTVDGLLLLNLLTIKIYNS